jgi:hypothetical protein
MMRGSIEISVDYNVRRQNTGSALLRHATFIFVVETFDKISAYLTLKQ